MHAFSGLSCFSSSQKKKKKGGGGCGGDANILTIPDISYLQVPEIGLPPFHGMNYLPLPGVSMLSGTGHRRKTAAISSANNVTTGRHKSQTGGERGKGKGESFCVIC